MIKGINTPYPIQWLAGLASIMAPAFVKYDPAKIVLTSFHGDGFRGNTAIIFKELCNHPVLKPVWLSRNKQIADSIAGEFGSDKVAYTHSPAGIRHLAGAAAIMLTHGTSDFPFMRLPRRAMRIQTYHGLPTKCGEYMRPSGDKKPGFFHRLILKYRFEPITHFLSSSAEVTSIFSKRFNLPADRFVETGFPACDLLLHQKSDEQLASKLWPAAPRADKLILYAPTYRRLARTRWFPFEDLDMKEMAEFLHQKNALLAFRPHPNDRFNFKKLSGFSNRFVLADDKTIENVYALLSITDVLITDYSSIYIEALLRDIPPVFIPYDRADYERGLSIPYDSLTPGPHVSTQKQLQDALQIGLEQPDILRKERENVGSFFFSGTDGKSLQRVVQFLEKSLKI